MVPSDQTGSGVDDLPTVSSAPQPQKTLPLLSRSTSSTLASVTTIGSNTPAVSGASLGLRCVSQPVDHTGDIIFVHGLNGSGWKTWARSQDPEHFWPQWLSDQSEPGTEPSALSSYRVWTFGYDSKLKRPTMGMDMTEFAKDLLLQLWTTFGATSTKRATPIIFVAHSMGGLVVKRALILGNEGVRYSAIVSRVRAIMFLATPHHGSVHAKYLHALLTITLSAKSYVRELGKESPEICYINESFRKYSKDVLLCSFYETQKTNIGGRKILVSTLLLNY